MARIWVAETQLGKLVWKVSEADDISDGQKVVVVVLRICLLACFLTKWTTPIPGVLRVGRDKIHRHPCLLGNGLNCPVFGHYYKHFQSKEGRKKQFGGEPAKWREERP